MTNFTTVSLNSKGEASLAAKLAEHGHNNDDLGAWISEVDEALGNRMVGENLSIELNNVRSAQGYTVHFEPSADEITIRTFDEDGE